MSGTRSRALHTTGVKQRPPTKQMIMSGMPHTTSGTKTELGRIIVEQAMQAMSILVFVLRKDGFALKKNSNTVSPSFASNSEGKQDFRSEKPSLVSGKQLSIMGILKRLQHIIPSVLHMHESSPRNVHESHGQEEIVRKQRGQYYGQDDNSYLSSMSEHDSRGYRLKCLETVDLR